MYFIQDEAEGDGHRVKRADSVPALDPSAFAGFGDREPRARAAPAVKPGVSWVGFLGGLAAITWVGGAAGVAFSSFDAATLRALTPLAQLALITAALAPGLLFWLAASAASEALKARRLAAELTRIARVSHAPFEAGALEAQALSHTMRADIASLTAAVSDALERLAQLETSTRSSAAAFSEIIAASSRDAEALSQTLTRERAALASLGRDMKLQTEEIAESIGRQVRLMREASKLVRAEMSAAEDALDSGLAAFAATADSVRAHASAMKGVTQEAVSATGRLDGAMGRMLHGLAEATRLSEAARQSSEQAVSAAKNTAGALRQSTLAAIDEAKRAAQTVRSESAAMQATAHDTLAMLREAAAKARANADKSIAAAPAAPAMDIYAAAAAARTRADAPIAKGDAPWRLAPISRLPQPANERGAGSLDADLQARALDLIADCGVDLHRVLSTHDLNQIAASSQKGAAARRRAVLAAAPSAVGRVTRRIKGSDDAHAIANEFRARPHLAKSERKGEDSDLVRAYLLIDAALAS